jgi:hypothetical protein
VSPRKVSQLSNCSWRTSRRQFIFSPSVCIILLHASIKLFGWDPFAISEAHHQGHRGTWSSNFPYWETKHCLGEYWQKRCSSYPSGDWYAFEGIWRQWR